MQKVFVLFFILICSSQVNAQLLDQLKADMVSSYDWILTQAVSKECKVVESFDINKIEETPVDKCQFLHEIEIYPNPTNGVIQVSFKANQTATTIIVTAMDGKIVYREEIDSFEGHFDGTIDLNGQNQGIYVLSIVQGKEVFVKKVILQ